MLIAGKYATVVYIVCTNQYSVPCTTYIPDAD